ncbi:MAG: DUF6154 family protein [Bacillus sp. (in: firmicutes)]
MKLVDDLYEHYRTKLTGEEEDIDILALATLEQLDRTDILENIQEMDDMELRSFFGLYIIELLKAKFAEPNAHRPEDDYFTDYRNIH